MHKRWIILCVLFLARTAMGFQFQSVASAAPFMVHDLSFSYAQIGTLIGLYMLPGVVISLPGGLLGRRFGDQAICLTGLTLMMLGGVVIGLSQTYGLAFAGRLLSGIGGILFNLVLTKMATDWFAGHRLVFTMGVLLASWPFGIAAGLLFQSQIATNYGWSSVMYAAAGLCAGALVLMAVFYRPPPADASPANALRPDRPSGFALPPMRETVPALISGGIWGSFNLGLVLFFSFVPLLLGEYGMQPTVATAQTSIALWICVLSVPLGGYIVQQLGHANASIVMFSCLAGAMLLLLPLGMLPGVLCAIVGISVGPPAGAIMALPGKILSLPNRAVGFGVFYTSNYAITSFGPMLAGVLRDYWSSAIAPVVLGAACFIIVVPLLAAFEFVSSKWNSLAAP